MTSPGCSYILSDLLNLLRGRVGGPTGFLTLALRGDPLARERLALLSRGFLDTTEGIGNGLRSWGGDAEKHSSREGEGDDVFDNDSTPAPNLNAGRGLALGPLYLKYTELVE